jgi:hypothetical protein
MKAQPLCTIVRQGLTAVLLAAVSMAVVAGQQASGPPTSLSVYRPPALALVQPAAGGSVPEDKPVLVFRFIPGEPNDLIDLRSFVVTVDGTDRSALFHVTSAEAWGPLSPVGANGRPTASAGPHQVSARICSTHGACSETSAMVMVVPSPSVAEDSDDRRRSFLDVLLDVARKLLRP